MEPGTRSILVARRSHVPDCGNLRFRWWFYRESGAYHGAAQLWAADEPAATQHIPRPAHTGILHLILDGTATGSPPLTRYARTVIGVKPC